MISDRVDLTENGDFSGGNRFGADEGLVLPRLGLNMTMDEYNALLEYERFFGRKYHESEHHEMFDHDRYIRKKVDSRCYRCGKEIRTPWSSQYGLCKECASDMDDEYDSNVVYSRRGWSVKIPWGNALMRDVLPIDLFGLR